MNDDILFSTSSPGIHVIAFEDQPLASAIAGWIDAHRDWAILRVRGEKCRDEARFMDECGAALQLPSYFGENWDALLESLRDLAWIREPNLLVVFTRADALLTSSEQSFGLLLKVLSIADEHWRNIRGDHPDVAPIGLRSLFTCSPNALPRLIGRIEATQIQFTRL